MSLSQKSVLGFLKQNGFQHDRNKWFMDVIRYNLKDETKRVKKWIGMALRKRQLSKCHHVLMYLRIDETLKDANIRYKDRNNEKRVIELESGTTVIMDGGSPTQTPRSIWNR